MHQNQFDSKFKATLVKFYHPLLEDQTLIPLRMSEKKS